jgi:hypothetical protein
MQYGFKTILVRREASFGPKILMHSSCAERAILSLLGRISPSPLLELSNIFHVFLSSQRLLLGHSDTAEYSNKPKKQKPCLKLAVFSKYLVFF